MACSLKLACKSVTWILTWLLIPHGSLLFTNYSNEEKKKKRYDKKKTFGHNSVELCGEAEM